MKFNNFPFTGRRLPFTEENGRVRRFTPSTDVRRTPHGTDGRASQVSGPQQGGAVQTQLL